MIRGAVEFGCPIDVLREFSRKWPIFRAKMGLSTILPIQNVDTAAEEAL